MAVRGRNISWFLKARGLCGSIEDYVNYYNGLVNRLLLLIDLGRRDYRIHTIPVVVENKRTHFSQRAGNFPSISLDNINYHQLTH